MSQFQTLSFPRPASDEPSHVTTTTAAVPTTKVHEGRKPMRRVRGFLRNVDEYTLWAFNPQPPLVPVRRTDRARTAQPGDLTVR